MDAPQRIQDMVAITLAELGLNLDPALLLRTILIQDGQFVGHKFRFDGGIAVWLAERNVIEVYDDRGKLRTCVQLGRSEGGEAA